jgi:hypothetical protein
LTTEFGRANLLSLLLTMTTLLRRLIVPVLVVLAWAPVAHAWSWPVQGPVLQPFAYDRSNPYLAGQHRGIDIGAGATGEPVRAPADGTVSFAGTVPTNGESVTIETADGYSVTLTHLGTVAVAKGVEVAEGDEVGTIGPSGTAEVDEPYVHLGIRVTSDPEGYLDPLSLLPPLTEAGTSDGGSAATQPNASGSSSASPAPAGQPVPAPTATAPAAISHPSAVEAKPARVSRPEHSRGRTAASRPAARPQSSPYRLPLSPSTTVGAGLVHRPRMPHRHASEPVSAWRRPVVEAVPQEQADLHSGHESRPSAHTAPAARPRHEDASVVYGLVCNGVAAFVAMAAAITAARRRRRDLIQWAGAAQVLPMPRRAPEDARRAA